MYEIIFLEERILHVTTAVKISCFADSAMISWGLLCGPYLAFLNHFDLFQLLALDLWYPFKIERSSYQKQDSDGHGVFTGTRKKVMEKRYLFCLNTITSASH